MRCLRVLYSLSPDILENQIAMVRGFAAPGARPSRVLTRCLGDPIPARQPALLEGRNVSDKTVTLWADWPRIRR